MSLGGVLDDIDGNAWIIDYEEQSPFRTFVSRRVVAFGEPWEPGPRIPHIIELPGGKRPGHFRVTSMQLVEVTPDAQFVEVGRCHTLRGRLERDATATGESTLTFVTENGEASVVVNDPAGSKLGLSVEVKAYAVRHCSSSPKPHRQYVWIICPYSMAELEDWRRRHSWANNPGAAVSKLSRADSE